LVCRLLRRGDLGYYFHFEIHSPTPRTATTSALGKPGVVNSHESALRQRGSIKHMRLPRRGERTAQLYCSQAERPHGARHRFQVKKFPQRNGFGARGHFLAPNSKTSRQGVV
jgi:hypothetical protein